MNTAAVIKQYSARAQAHTSAYIDIQGRTLAEAIENGWEKIKRYLSGNASGCTVVSAVLEVEKHKYTQSGGKHFARLVVACKGGAMPHMVDPKTYVSEFDFPIAPGSEKDHVFEIAPIPKPQKYEPRRK